MHLLPTPDIMRPPPLLLQTPCTLPEMHLPTHEKHSVQRLRQVQFFAASAPRAHGFRRRSAAEDRHEADPRRHGLAPKL